MIRRSSFAFLSATLLLGSALDPAWAGNVLVVDASGGGAYRQIQPAVDAAVDGDTILVKSGNYPGFTISDKSLSVVVDFGASGTVQQSVGVLNLSASKSVLLAGFSIHGNSNGIAFLAQSVAGSLRVEDCTITAITSSDCSAPTIGAFLYGDDDVGFCRCTIQGAQGNIGDYEHSCPGGEAVWTQSSSVAFYDCSIRGGDGGHGSNSGCANCPTDGDPEDRGATHSRSWRRVSSSRRTRASREGAAGPAAPVATRHASAISPAMEATAGTDSTRWVDPDRTRGSSTWIRWTPAGREASEEQARIAETGTPRAFRDRRVSHCTPRTAP
jgi:hypothetical protein